MNIDNWNEDKLYTTRYELKRKITFLSPYDEDWQKTIDLYNKICDKIYQLELLDP